MQIVNYSMTCVLLLLYDICFLLLLYDICFLLLLYDICVLLLLYDICVLLLLYDICFLLCNVFDFGAQFHLLILINMDQISNYLLCCSNKNKWCSCTCIAKLEIVLNSS